MTPGRLEGSTLRRALALTNRVSEPGYKITGVDHMMTNARVLTAIRPIEALLCRTMAEAVTTADTAATGTLLLPRTAAYQSTRVHMARARARVILEDELTDGWFVNEFERHNTALHLYTNGIAMRLLHTPTGVAPAPGQNFARRAWYTAPLDESPAQLVEEDVKLLALWSADFQAGLVDIRVVRPLRPWAYGASEKVDISIPLDPNSTFTSQGYDTRDDEEDLSFPTREEAGEEGDAADASA